MQSQFLNVPFGEAQLLYNALKLFDDISYRNEYLVNIKLQPGRVSNLVFRISHKIFHSKYSQSKLTIIKFFFVGQCAVFDNHRVLHGRSGFGLRADSGERAYHGGYTDWDELISKLSVLRIKLGMA